MSSTTPYPPCQSRPAKKITSQEALSSLSAFLSASESTPWLHPDARITPDEIKYSANGGPQGGIILHHLRRIEKGLNGEILAPEPDDVFGIDGDDTATAYQEGGRKKGGLKKTAEEEGWQDPETYARSQTILEGDVGERDMTDTHDIDMDADADVMDVDDAPAMSKADKEAKKAAKKDRRKAEKKEKEDMKRAKG